jgi:hypothetical protein
MRFPRFCGPATAGPDHSAVVPSIHGARAVILDDSRYNHLQSVYKTLAMSERVITMNRRAHMPVIVPLFVTVLIGWVYGSDLSEGIDQNCNFG